MASGDKDTFVHSLANAKFKQRNDAIFGQLSGLEATHEKEVPKSDPFAETFAEKAKPRRPKKVPDHVLHPEKWTKYSLEEDGTSEVEGGDELNRDIAMKFITELRSRNSKEGGGGGEKEEMDMGEALYSGNDTSLKRKRDQVEKDEEEASRVENLVNVNSAASSSAAVIMKTYEFGQKQAKKEVSHSKDVKEEVLERELNLSHLEEETDNDIRDETVKDNEMKSDQIKTKFNVVRKTKKNLRKSEPVGDDND